MKVERIIRVNFLRKRFLFISELSDFHSFQGTQ